jgi:hypothetical protein
MFMRLPDMRLRLVLPALALFAAAFFAVAPIASAQAQRATLVHEESIRVSPAADAAKLGEAGRGHELVILDTSRDWTQVEAIIREPKKDADEDDPQSEGKTITGWLPNKALVNQTTQTATRLFSAKPPTPKTRPAAAAAAATPRKTPCGSTTASTICFPSPLAAEGLYRAADIRWQIERSDVLTRPSARERDSYMRGQIDEQWMKLVVKKFPGTKWADMAAFHLSKTNFAATGRARQSVQKKKPRCTRNMRKSTSSLPSAPEALYQAAWRRSALVEIYKTEANQKKADEAKTRSLELTQRIISQYGQSDWALRAQSLMFYIQQGVPTFGNTTD